MPPSYPYPPSPYPSGKWSQSQDLGYKTNFQLPPTRPLVTITYTGHSSTENVLAEILPERTSFQAWDAFDGKVQQARENLHAHCAGLSSEQLGSVMTLCTAAHQQLTTRRNITSEAQISQIVSNAYTSVAQCHQHLDSASTTLEPAHRARVPTTAYRYGGSPQMDLVFLREDLQQNQIQSRHRLVAFEVKKPDLPLTASALTSNNPNHVAQSHNEKFERNSATWYVRMMSQALTYAMHTKCGCVILTNHNQAMFMQAVPIRQSSGTWKLNVKVSKLYRCSEAKSCFHAALAILRISSESSDISPSLQEAFGQMQEARGRLRGTRSRSNRSGSNSLRIRGGQTSAGPSTRTRSQTRRNSSSRRNVTALDGLYQPELIRHLMESSDDIITHEGHSTVLRSRCKNVDVAVKYWNCDTSRGLEMLSHELKVYEEVVLKHAHLLGTVLPRLVALWNEPKTDTVIATEYVGEAVTRRYGESVLFVGGKELDSNDYGLLEKAAFDALEKMHSTGLRHRDLDERNIRAKREVAEKGEVRWKVWFIDLGMASFSGDWNEAVADEDSLWGAIRGPANDAE